VLSPAGPTARYCLVSQPVIAADLNQNGPATPRQLFAIGKRDHVIGPAMQDNRVRIDVYCHGPASGTSDNDLGLMLIKLGLGWMTSWSWSLRCVG